MPVSQTSTRSAFSSLAFSARKAGSEGEPVSSSPSNSTLTLQGRPPVSRKARQASRKVINWPLSSQAPRATIRWPVRPVDEPRLEGRRRPQFERIGRLHVVMAVEQHMRRVARLRLGASRRPSAGPVVGALGRFEAEAAQFARPASRRRVRNRGNGRDRPRSRESRAARTGASSAVGLVGVDRWRERRRAWTWKAPAQHRRRRLVMSRTLSGARRALQLPSGGLPWRKWRRAGVGASAASARRASERLVRRCDGTGNRACRTAGSRAGSVSTQAERDIAQRRPSWMPEPLASIVPATPDDRTWVVETGRPRPSAAPIVAMATISAAAPWP